MSVTRGPERVMAVGLELHELGEEWTVLGAPSLGMEVTATMAPRLEGVWAFWEGYVYSPVIGDFDDRTRLEAARMYVLARNALGGDFVEVGRHFSVGVNYMLTAMKGGGRRPLVARYDLVMELFMHAPTEGMGLTRRLMEKGAVTDTRSTGYANVFVGVIRRMEMDTERRVGRIVAGSEGDMFDVRFSIEPPETFERTYGTEPEGPRTPQVLVKDGRRRELDMEFGRRRE